VNGRIVGGTIRFKGRDLTTLTDEELRQLRGSEIAMIYQEPMASLNPAMKVGMQLMEVPMIHQGMAKPRGAALARQIVADVRLPDPDRILQAYPHQLSGGQQQRIVIAMALMSKPALLILDEPTTALDVTVEAGIVDLVKDLGKKYGTSMLFISHNLGLVLETCDRLCVMYSGEAVETGASRTSSTRCATPIPRRCSARSRCPAPTRTPGRWWPSPATSRCRTNARRAATSARAATISSRDAATPQDIPMATGAPGTGTRPAACASEIDWDKPAEADRPGEKNPGRRRGAAHGGSAKYYEVSGLGLFGGGDTKVVKANETLSFEAREGETLAIVGESGCGKSTFAKVLMGLETATSGKIMLYNQSSRTPRSSSATPTPCPRCRWCSRTPSTR
jgi:peptide/nickel transport system ATP-binding protein